MVRSFIRSFVVVVVVVVVVPLPHIVSVSGWTGRAPLCAEECPYLKLVNNFLVVLLLAPVFRVAAAASECMVHRGFSIPSAGLRARRPAEQSAKERDSVAAEKRAGSGD